MKVVSVKSSSYIQILLDKYIYIVVINRSYKNSLNTNLNTQLINEVNLNLT